jgi:hypothetical protein
MVNEGERRKGDAAAPPRQLTKSFLTPLFEFLKNSAPQNEFTTACTTSIKTKPIPAIDLSNKATAPVKSAKRAGAGLRFRVPP